MKWDNLTDEDFARLPAEQRLFLRKPLMFATSFGIMLVGVAVITLVCCKAYDAFSYVGSFIW